MVYFIRVAVAIVSLHSNRTKTNPFYAIFSTILWRKVRQVCMFTIQHTDCARSISNTVKLNPKVSLSLFLLQQE